MSVFENGTFLFSLPRPKLAPQQKHHKVREFSYKIDLDGLKRMKRAVSLEHMLDSSGSGSSSTFSAGSSNLGPNVWVADSKNRASASATLGRSNKFTAHNSNRLIHSHSQSRLAVGSQQQGATPSSSRSPGSALRKQYHQHQQQQHKHQELQQAVLDDYHQRMTTYPELLKQQQVPSYCTIDRSRLRKRQKENQNLLGVNSPHLHTQTLPRKPKRTPSLNAGSAAAALMGRPKIRSRSVELLDLDRDPVSCERAIENEFKSSNFEKTFPSGGGGELYGVSTTYIGDAGIEELRRVTSEYILDKAASTSSGTGTTMLQHGKSVTIHPNVTEFHYPGKTLVIL